MNWPGLVISLSMGTAIEEGGLLRKSSIWAKSVPVLRTASIDNRPGCTLNSDIATGDLQWSKLRTVCKCKSRFTWKQDRSSNFEFGENYSATRRGMNVVQGDWHACCYCRRDLRPRCAEARRCSCNGVQNWCGNKRTGASDWGLSQFNLFYFPPFCYLNLRSQSKLLFLEMMLLQDN